MAAFDTSKFKSIVVRLTPKQRQYAALGAVIACGVGALWAVFAFTGGGTKINPQQSAASAASTGTVAPTNIGVMAPGQQVNPVDQWVGTAGRKLAQYEHEREEQSRINRDRKEFEDRTMQRFGELEQRLTTAGRAQPEAPKPQPAPVAPTPPSPTQYPPSSALPANLPPPGRPTPAAAMPTGMPSDRIAPSTPGLVHVSMVDAGQSTPATQAQSPSTGSNQDNGSRPDTVSTYLPVSFTRGVLLGGLDAPTGGQSQSNPHPVLIRLSDNAVLPNKFRGEYRECFVIAAGYGDIGSERAYLRTENLSCVRDDGSTLEVKIQGSVYGEDGKVGMRGRLVTKQGQMLANALLAGIASGIGQGLSTSSTTYSTSALGTIANASGSDAYRTGLGSGVGRALDRLAQYYIKLAEQTFPVVEIDAGREVDVVITKGVRIDAPITATSRSSSNVALARRSPEEQTLKGINDEDY
jgi:conjugal transfer pilus assembly protein TraB